MSAGPLPAPAAVVAEQTRPRPSTPGWVVVAMAVAGGLAMRQAFPQPGWWWLLVPALGLVLASAAVESRARTVLAAGLLGGWAFYLPLVHWSSLFLGWLPWLALGTMMALGWALGYVAIAWAHRWGRRAWPGPIGSWLVVPAVVAGLWTARDALSSSWPYGGFAWGRLAQSLAWSPLLEVVSWLGLAGTGFVLVLVAEWLVQAVRLLLTAGVRPSLRVWPLAGVALLSLGLAALPGYRVATAGTIRVAGVQGGDERAGYFMGGAPGDVLAAHLRATGLLDPASKPDVVVWPEGSAEWDPTRYPQLASQFDALVARYGAPFLLGSGTERDGTSYQSEYVWPVTGGQRHIYDKHNPVPFGEYVPDRSVYEKIVPNLVGLIGRDYTPGTGSPVLPLSTRSGVPAPVGVAICYDIIDDALGRTSVRDGATWLVSPTNNADFGRTDELDQQLAFARLRAVETGRSVVQVSTVGHTAAFGPDGRELAREPWYTPAVMTVDVPLSSTITPAVRFGPAYQGIAATIGLGGLLLAGLLARRRGTSGGAVVEHRIS
ncbi:apolipoprotein N-acyltransferase [Raineyella antarctica]|nr:apolipoprotein N-acyltransferase [Raineyella antarctica]